MSITQTDALILSKAREAIEDLLTIHWQRILEMREAAGGKVNIAIGLRLDCTRKKPYLKTTISVPLRHKDEIEEYVERVEDGTLPLPFGEPQQTPTQQEQTA